MRRWAAGALLPLGRQWDPRHPPATPRLTVERVVRSLVLLYLDGVTGLNNLRTTSVAGDEIHRHIDCTSATD
jgi:hypothetical protein